MNTKQVIIYTGAFAGIAGCLVDIASFFVFASRYQGYDQIRQPLSELGSSISPVSASISAWWAIFGILMVVLALGFYTAYTDNGRSGKMAAICIALYGLGEGIGSGLFKFDIINNVKTVSYSLHELFGSIGVFSILALPFLVFRITPFNRTLRFRTFSSYIIIFGFIFFIMFSIRYVNLTNGVTDLINKYTGLWQRLFLFNYYIYLITVSLRMIRDSSGIGEQVSP
jgi:hypothetical protein